MCIKDVNLWGSSVMAILTISLKTSMPVLPKLRPCHKCSFPLQTSIISPSPSMSLSLEGNNLLDLFIKKAALFSYTSNNFLKKSVLSHSCFLFTKMLRGQACLPPGRNVLSIGLRIAAFIPAHRAGALFSIFVKLPIND
jgi:hypothetical protein